MESFIEYQINSFLKSARGKIQDIEECMFANTKYERENLSYLYDYLEVIWDESNKFLFRVRCEKEDPSFFAYLNRIVGVSYDFIEEYRSAFSPTDGYSYRTDDSFIRIILQDGMTFLRYLEALEDALDGLEKFYDLLDDRYMTKEKIRYLLSFSFCDEIYDLNNTFFKRTMKELLNLAVQENLAYPNDKCLANFKKQIQKNYNRVFLHWTYIDEKKPNNGTLCVTIDEFDEEVIGIYINGCFMYIDNDRRIDDVIAWKEYVEE